MNASPSEAVRRLLADRIGLDPSSIGESMIVQGVRTRMAALGLRSEAEYDRLLGDRDDEPQLLIEEVVVPESWFFRDSRPFDVLADRARAGWRDQPSRPPMACLSLPCAGGEEPYSIAITLREAGLDPGRFRVDAIDVSTRALAKAIAGVYTRNAFRGIDSSARSGYFREQNGVYTIDPSIRSNVRFHLGNILDPGLLADLAPFDVVFCRNLLIYFDDESKARAFVNLSRLVAEDGVLFLGHADRLEILDKTMFSPTGDKGAFAYRKTPDGAPSLTGRPPIRGGTPAPVASKPGKPVGLPSGRSPAPKPGPPVPSRQVGPKVSSPSSPPVAAVPAATASGSGVSPANSATPLGLAQDLADHGRYDEASGLVESVIRSAGAAAPAFFLLGLIAQAAGNRDRAEAHFLKAIYLDPQHDEALLALALLARRKGDIAGETAYRKRADRVLARKGVS